MGGCWPGSLGMLGDGHPPESPLAPEGLTAIASQPWSGPTVAERYRPAHRAGAQRGGGDG